jgi:thioredoxin-like negative regulator of GroEL
MMLLIGLVASVAAQSQNITDKNFFELVGGRPALIKFVASQCGPTLADEWDELADLHEYSPLLVGSVDCADTPVVCSQYGVTEFPTILSFIAGEYTGAKYHGVIDKESLEAFASDLASDCDPRGSTTYAQCTEEQKSAFGPLIHGAKDEELIEQAKDVQQIIRDAEAAHARAVKRWRAAKSVTKQDELAQKVARARDTLRTTQPGTAASLRRLKAALLTRNIAQKEQPKNFFPASVKDTDVEDAIAACPVAAVEDKQAAVKGNKEAVREGDDNGAENHTLEETESCESSATP